MTREEFVAQMHAEVDKFDREFKEQYPKITELTAGEWDEQFEAHLMLR